MCAVQDIVGRKVLFTWNNEVYKVIKVYEQSNKYLLENIKDGAKTKAPESAVLLIHNM